MLVRWTTVTHVDESNSSPSDGAKSGSDSDPSDDSNHDSNFDSDPDPNEDDNPEKISTHGNSTATLALAGKPKNILPAYPNYEALRPYFGWIPVRRIRETLKNTT